VYRPIATRTWPIAVEFRVFCVGRSVCPLVTTMNSRKKLTADLGTGTGGPKDRIIEPQGLLLDGGSDPPGKGQF